MTREEREWLEFWDACVIRSRAEYATPGFDQSTLVALKEVFRRVRALEEQAAPSTPEPRCHWCKGGDGVGHVVIFPRPPESSSLSLCIPCMGDLHVRLGRTLYDGNDLPAKLHGARRAKELGVYYRYPETKP